MSAEVQQVEIDKTPSGWVEWFYGRDGMLRAYVRLVDHEAICERISEAGQSMIDSLDARLAAQSEAAK